MKIKLLGMAVLGLMVLVSGPFTAVFADEPGTPRFAQKAVRGLTNAGFGVLVEVPKTVYLDTLEDGPLYGLTVGLLEGLSWGIARTLVGVYEVVTFPFPVPEGYRPIYQPHYPFEAGKTDLAE
jgi:putative exosortase-associated protein (TIGR04073 family)